MKSYLILIFLVIFSVMVSIMGTFGTFPAIDIPPSIVYQFTEENVLAMTEGAAETTILTLPMIAGTALNILLTTLWSVLNVGSLLIIIGVPPVIAVGIQVIIYAVYAWDVVSYIFNRPKPNN